MKKYLQAVMLIVLLTACSKSGDSPDPGSNPPPPIINPPGPDDIQITKIQLSYGYTDDIVTVEGKNFGTDAGAITAKINNVVAAIQPLSLSNTASTSTVNIKVPFKCGSGPVTLSRNGKTATGPDFYYIPSATVTTLYGAFDKAGFVNGSGTSMRLNNPVDFVFDKNNNIYLVERGGILGTTQGSLIRKIAAGTGQLSTFSGGPLDGNTANYNVPWSVSLPANVNSSVNGGKARFNLPYGIVISEDPGSNAFKLLVNQNNFIRIINEETATGVFAGNPHDTTGGGTPPYGSRHEAHIFPLPYQFVIYPNNADYGSPTLYWLDAGPSLSKIDANGNITVLTDLKNNSPAYLTKNPDGNMYFHGVSSSGKGFFKLTPAGALSAWVGGADSVLNRATGKMESFASNIENGGVMDMNFDKDNNLFFFTATSAYTDLYKFFPDKSFIRLFHWQRLHTGKDGVNAKADVSSPAKLIVRDNGDIYFIEGFAIRKISFE